MLDTSYLITLADSTREHHDTARKYWRYFTEIGLPIYLPTIVVSEFFIRQEIPPDILRACVVLPFNWDDALKAAELDFPRFNREPGSRDALKDDVKIIAQAVVKDAMCVITDDTKTFFKFAKQVVSDGKGAFRPIKLEDTFEITHFDGGQAHLALDHEQEDEQSVN